MNSARKNSNSHRTFIDLFAGCGGLSLGLMEAGWQGLFAIEQNPSAFKTLKFNLIDNRARINNKSRFTWSEWLDTTPFDIREFIEIYHSEIKSMRGKVCLVAGGPPCQGFSFAGKRLSNDPRNDLIEFYLEVAKLVQPEVVLLENVRGIATEFVAKEYKKDGKDKPLNTYAARISDALSKDGYFVQQELVKASDFGVPQVRPRHFTVGIKKEIFSSGNVPDFFQILQKIKPEFLQSKRLPVTRAVTVAEAISDLRTDSAEITMCTDSESPSGFREIVYRGPESQYQKLMRKGSNGSSPNSLRLVNHRPDTIHRFEQILRTCRKGVHLSNADRKRLGIGKHAITPLSPDLPSPTLTTLPDDLLHYAEPRVHTVREYARLQSFPDWFEFCGKFTTGGNARVRECPRYTQVGNAVPPLLAEAIGIALNHLH